MTTRLNIKNKEQIIELLQDYLTERRVSFPMFRHLFTTLYYIEFFFNLKSEIFLRRNKEDIIDFFHNEFEFRNFLNQTQEIFNITVYTVIKYVILVNEPHLSKKQVDCVNELYKKFSSLVDLTHYYLSHLRHSLDSDEKEEQIIRTIYIVCKLYLLSRIFIQDFHNIMEESR
jgi:hypothetical protein